MWSLKLKFLPVVEEKVDSLPVYAVEFMFAPGTDVTFRLLLRELN